MTEELPSPHSPLGASGASRWMKCPGSVVLAQGVTEDEEDDTFSGPGSAAHAVGEYCLTYKQDAWTLMGQQYDPDTGVVYPEHWAKNERPAGVISVNKEMVDAVQLYLDAVRRTHPDYNQGNSWIERPFYCPSIHKYFYGRSDFGYVDYDRRILHVWDYKHGAGIVVEVQDNAQAKYYACGMLEEMDLWGAVDRVVLHIAQPRGFHMDGPIREWALTADALGEWLHTVLVPAMDRALVSRETKSGEHCRFCPARLRACPQLLDDIKELSIMVDIMEKKGGAEQLTSEQIAFILDKYDVHKIAAKAAEQVGFRRASAGHAIPGRKLVKARANRAFREEMDIKEADGQVRHLTIQEAAKEKFGDAAMTKPELKSPAKIDELPEGEAFTSLWAYKPDAGFALARDDDARRGVGKDVKSMFSDQTKARKGKKA